VVQPMAAARPNGGANAGGVSTGGVNANAGNAGSAGTSNSAGAGPGGAQAFPASSRLLTKTFPKPSSTHNRRS
jgi:hypothetical protein